MSDPFAKQRSNNAYDMIVFELKQCYVLASENHSDMGNKDTLLKWPIFKI